MTFGSFSLELSLSLFMYFPFNQVMMHDGSKWQRLSNGLSGKIFALISANEELIAAGEQDIARWDVVDEVFVSLDDGCDGAIYAMSAM
jgi:hypothetical protein